MHRRGVAHLDLDVVPVQAHGDVRVDGGDDLIGFGELEEGVVEPDLDLGEVED